MSPSPTVTSRDMTADQVRAVEQLIFHEAALIDQRRLEEWLQLFADDAQYWIPNNSGDSNPSQEGPIIQENRQAMALRVARLQHPAALTQVPPPRTVHFITNIVVTPVDSQECEVTSNQLVYFARGEVEMQYPGTWQHQMRRQDEGWRIGLKKISLLTNNRPLLAIPLL